jgi:hypothetical protein
VPEAPASADPPFPAPESTLAPPFPPALFVPALFAPALFAPLVPPALAPPDASVCVFAFPPQATNPMKPPRTIARASMCSR